MKPNKSNSRPWVSILMLFGFMTIVVTGLLSYVLRYSSVLSSIHTVFGLMFVGYGILHLKNNITPLLGYFKLATMRRVIWCSVLLVPLTIAGVFIGLPPFKWVIDAGYAIKELRPIDRQIVTSLHTQIGANGRNILVELKAGEHYSGPGAKVLGITTTGVPQMAVWVEDGQGNYLETLYVTKKASNSSYVQSLFGGEEVRRPEALPHWSHVRGIRSDDGLLMPSRAKPIVDALTGATPLSSFNLNSVVSSVAERLVVKLEINRSFDYNAVYHPKAFPDDAVYSGSGHSAQPSLIYAAQVDFTAKQPYYFMQLIGRGHHSGANGEVYKDLSGITTAKQMVDRVIVEIH